MHSGTLRTTYIRTEKRFELVWRSSRETELVLELVSPVRLLFKSEFVTLSSQCLTASGCTCSGVSPPSLSHALPPSFSPSLDPFSILHPPTNSLHPSVSPTSLFPSLPPPSKSCSLPLCHSLPPSLHLSLPLSLSPSLSLSLSLSRGLSELCADDRAALRKSSAQTLFSTISAHGTLLHTNTWEGVLGEVGHVILT